MFFRVGRTQAPRGDFVFKKLKKFKPDRLQIYTVYWYDYCNVYIKLWLIYMPFAKRYDGISRKREIRDFLGFWHPPYFGGLLENIEKANWLKFHYFRKSRLFPTQ